MESDFDTLLRGVMALAILSLIPVVIFALWLDHFEKRLRNLLIKNPNFEREPELEKVRFFSLLVLLFQFTLFLGADEIRGALALVCDLILVLGASTQLALQLRAEKQLQKDQPGSESVLAITLKMVRSWILAATVCGLLSIFGILFTRWIVTNQRLPEVIGTLLLILGGVGGMGCGILLNFALVPYHILKIFPASPMSGLPVAKMIQDLFELHQTATPRLWMIELKKFRLIDLAIAGLSSGRGPFKYALFISQFALNSVNEAELKALLLVEIGHVKLQHQRKRLTLVSGLILNSLTFAILVTLWAEQTYPGKGGYDFLGTTLGFIFFVTSIKWISLQKETQEFEADAYALDHLNLDFEVLSNALRKLDYFSVKNIQSDNGEKTPLMGFPETERRIFLLNAYLIKKEKQAATHSDDLAA